MMSRTPENKFLNWLAQPSVKPYLIALLSTVIIFFQANLDPFGLISASDKSSALLFSKIISPFYGKQLLKQPFSLSTNNQQHNGRENIVVVLYDQPYFDRNRKSSNKPVWPIPVDKHRRLLQKITEANPAAVFLDVYFTIENKERENAIAKFYSQLKTIDCPNELSADECAEEAQAPTFIASVLRNTKPSAINPETDIPIAPPRVALAEINQQQHHYALQDCQQGANKDCIDTSTDTAAYALYQRWCARTNELKAGSCQSIDTKNIDQTLFLQWGYAPSQDMVELQRTINPNATHCQTDGNGFSLLTKPIHLMLKELIGQTSNRQQLCPYHNTLGALMVEKMPASDLRTMLKNKVVLVGATDYPLADKVESYVHGYIPGVFWHATALDNLIEKPKHFLRIMEKKQSANVETTIALLLFLTMAVFIHHNSLSESRLKSNPAINTEANQKILTHIHLYTSAIALLLLSVLICLIWVGRDYAPENWVGIAGLLFILCSGQVIAIHRINAGLAIFFIEVSSQPLGAIFYKIGLLSSQRIDAVNRAIHNLHQTIRVFLFILLGGLFVFCFISIALTVFFIPIIYFSTQPSSAFTLTIFTLLYGWLIFIAFRQWLRLTQYLTATDKAANKAASAAPITTPIKPQIIRSIKTPITTTSNTT